MLSDLEAAKWDVEFKKPGSSRALLEIYEADPALFASEKYDINELLKPLQFKTSTQKMIYDEKVPHFKTKIACAALKIAQIHNGSDGRTQQDDKEDDSSSDE